VVPSHLLDTKLHPFTTLKATGVASEDGDKAFDEEPLPAPKFDAEDLLTDAGNATVTKAVIPIATAH
jgi:tRNA 2-thiocytidine biosynthesis protein TtcA